MFELFNGNTNEIRKMTECEIQYVMSGVTCQTTWDNLNTSGHMMYIEITKHSGYNHINIPGCGIEFNY